jgi:hypothetical protein
LTPKTIVRIAMRALGALATVVFASVIVLAFPQPLFNI